MPRLKPDAPKNPEVRKELPEDFTYQPNEGINKGEDALSPLRDIPEFQVPAPVETIAAATVPDSTVAQPEKPKISVSDPVLQEAIDSGNTYLTFVVNLAIANGTDPAEALAQAKASLGIE